MSNVEISFSPLNIDSKNQIEKFLSRFPVYSDFNFISLYSWNIDNSTSYSFHNENFIIKLPDYLSGDDVYSVLGDNDILTTLDVLMEHLKLSGSKPILKLVPEVVVNQLTNTNKYTYTEDPDNHDFILSTSLLSEMKSSEFRGKRSGLNKFIRNFGKDISTEELELAKKQTQEAIFKVLRDWMKSGNKDPDDAVSEIKAIERLLENTNRLNLEGIGVFHAHDLIAFSLLERIADSEFAINHFEKANFEYAGVFTFLKKTTSEWLLDKNVKFINHEQDLGIPGLRRAKQLLHPVDMHKKYIVEPASSIFS